MSDGCMNPTCTRPAAQVISVFGMHVGGACDECAVRAWRGLNPGEIVAIPSELPDPENWEIHDGGAWIPAADLPSRFRYICRPINEEAGE